MYSIKLGVSYLFQKNYVDVKDFHIFYSLLAVIKAKVGKLFFIKDQIVIFQVFQATQSLCCNYQLCPCSTKAVMCNTKMNKNIV